MATYWYPQRATHYYIPALFFMRQRNNNAPAPVVFCICMKSLFLQYRSLSATIKEIIQLNKTSQKITCSTMYLFPHWLSKQTTFAVAQHISAFIMTVLMQLLNMMIIISNGEHLPLVHVVAIYMAGIKKELK